MGWGQWDGDSEGQRDGGNGMGTVSDSGMGTMGGGQWEGDSK